jgi:hypothetical protein
MNDITIPPEALEAAAEKISHHRFNRQWNLLTFAEKDMCLALARAACLAAINTWPGMLIDHRDWPECNLMVLPLTKEPSHD